MKCLSNKLIIILFLSFYSLSSNAIFSQNEKIDEFTEPGKLMQLLNLPYTEILPTLRLTLGSENMALYQLNSIYKEKALLRGSDKPITLNELMLSNQSLSLGTDNKTASAKASLCGLIISITLSGHVMNLDNMPGRPKLPKSNQSQAISIKPDNKKRCLQSSAYIYERYEESLTYNNKPQIGLLNHSGSR